MNLTGILVDHAEQRGEQIALIEGDRSLTYEELRDQVRRMAWSLADSGLGPGSRVLVFVPMSIDLYVILLGILHLGAVAVFVDPGMGRRQIEAALQLAEPDGFVAITKAHLLRFVSPALRRVPVKLRVGGGRLARRLAGLPTDRQREPLSPEAPALLTFTSGTTGRPKGAMRSHGFLLAQHRALAGVLGTRPDDVELPALPIFLLNSLAAGATAVIPPIGKRVADVDPRQLCDTILRHGVTTSAGSPALYRPLVEYCREQRVVLPSIRALFIGGAPVSPGLLADLKPLLPNGESWVVYGSTEAEPIAHISGSDVLAETATATSQGAGLCVGVPVDCVRVRLEDEEILVCGDHVNQTYYRDPEAVRRHKVTDGDGRVWHRTGDLGRFDESGRLWLLGRKDHVVERSSRRIYPFAVELAARSLPGVTQAALIEHDGQVRLVVEGEGEGLRERLVALHPGIDVVQLMGRIPTDPRHNAKIDYARLRKML